jgi:hypothetical protein
LNGALCSVAKIAGHCRCFLDDAYTFIITMTPHPTRKLCRSCPAAVAQISASVAAAREHENERPQRIDRESSARLLEIIVFAVYFVLPQACKGVETLAATVALIGASCFLR